MSGVSHGSVAAVAGLDTSSLPYRPQIPRCVPAAIDGGHWVTGNPQVDWALNDRRVAALFVPHDAGVHHGGQQPVYF